MLWQCQMSPTSNLKEVSRYRGKKIGTWPGMVLNFIPVLSSCFLPPAPALFFQQSLFVLSGGWRLLFCHPGSGAARVTAALNLAAKLTACGWAERGDRGEQLKHLAEQKSLTAHLILWKGLRHICIFFASHTQNGVCLAGAGRLSDNLAVQKEQAMSCPKSYVPEITPGMCLPTHQYVLAWHFITQGFSSVQLCTEEQAGVLLCQLLLQA